ncbi:hypothetical protein [Amycolatopsis sp. CFH S0078]|uniref:hypothetical protein n=1 Tax=Amycolatopsis sp. CFH S0078 TaxID=1644108 RepID=UPI00106E987F|nr:hypothetical protein [Amycolatopsis sp. CFH S0078]
MNGRRSTLVAADKFVRLAPGAAFVYPGVTLTRYENGEIVGTVWLPLGDAPTEADDELLIAHLHAALLWSHGHDEAPVR